MSIDVDYTEVPGMPTLVRVSIAANDAQGICQLEARGTGRPDLLFPTVDRMCETTAEWSGNVLRSEIIGGIDVFASRCPDAMMVPDLAERIRACRAGSQGMEMRHRDPPPPSMVTPTPAARCPGVTMGDCSSNSQCDRARDRLQRLRGELNTLCETYHSIRDRADVYRALAISFSVAAAIAIGISIASAFVPPPFGTVIGLVALALAIVLIIAMAAAVTAALWLESRALAYRGFIEEAIEDYARALRDAESLCICNGCGVRAEDIRLPDACRGIPLPNNVTLH